MSENPSAFPLTDYDPGMSLRDWFAGQAVSALIARHRVDVGWSNIAPRAYQIADAMLEARQAALTKGE